MPTPSRYNLVAENPQSTVVAEYQAAYRTATTYQSEAELEHAFIAQLESQAYAYLPLTSEADLVRKAVPKFKSSQKSATIVPKKG